MIFRVIAWTISQSTLGPGTGKMLKSAVSTRHVPFFSLLSLMDATCALAWALFLKLLHTPCLQINITIFRIKISYLRKIYVSMIWINFDNRYQVLSVINHLFHVWSFEQILLNSPHTLNHMNFLWGVGSPHHSALLSCWKVFVWVDNNG
jgi:hypothetical protein